MLVFHDPATLLHETVELLGAKLLPALESPERLHAILSALRSPDSPHELRQVDYAHGTGEDDDNSEKRSDAAAATKRHRLNAILRATHAPDYLEHLRTAHARWVADGLIGEAESVLPECFPLRPRSGAAGPRARRPPPDVFARAGFFAFDMSSGLAQGSWGAIVASANLALEAVDAVAGHGAGGDDGGAGRSVLALCRPPGHHCDTATAGGYCYVNNAVVAVHTLRSVAADAAGGEKGGARVAVLDLDFHHGNGTQDYFYESRETLYVSIHGEDEYPYYTGFEDEVGAGEGVGFNVNLPLKVGSSAEEYLGKVDIMVEKTREFGPEYIVVSLGFDTFMLDPLGKFQLDTEDYASIGKRVREGLKGVPAVILLEGGYVVDRLGANLLSFLAGWEAGEGR